MRRGRDAVVERGGHAQPRGPGAVRVPPLSVRDAMGRRPRRRRRGSDRSLPRAVDAQPPGHQGGRHRERPQGGSERDAADGRSLRVAPGILRRHRAGDDQPPRARGGDVARRGGFGRAHAVRGGRRAAAGGARGEGGDAARGGWAHGAVSGGVREEDEPGRAGEGAVREDVSGAPGSEGALGRGVLREQRDVGRELLPEGHAEGRVHARRERTAVADEPRTAVTDGVRRRERAAHVDAYYPR
mmetsp:Transcript_6310/g.23096  ORF Transcript_6310/g.23096 Transcript_6310/m.23096 type:complete len:242 (+) Transcript_6310:1939-2664(+)